MANISTAITSFPFRPLSCPCSLTIKSFFFIITTRRFGAQSSFWYPLVAIPSWSSFLRQQSPCFVSKFLVPAHPKA
ncbi:hypothetical protein ACFX1S_023090 [Malus domestica]